MNSLSTETPKRTSKIPVQAILQAGATNLAKITNDGNTLRSIQAAYSQSLTNTLYFSTGTIAIALPFALCMEWLNVKKVSRNRVICENSDRSGMSEGTRPPEEKKRIL